MEVTEFHYLESGMEAYVHRAFPMLKLYLF